MTPWCQTQGRENTYSCRYDRCQHSLTICFASSPHTEPVRGRRIGIVIHRLVWESKPRGDFTMLASLREFDLCSWYNLWQLAILISSLEGSQEAPWRYYMFLSSHLEVWRPLQFEGVGSEFGFGGGMTDKDAASRAGLLFRLSVASRGVMWGLLCPQTSIDPVALDIQHFTYYNGSRWSVGASIVLSPAALIAPNFPTSC